MQDIHAAIVAGIPPKRPYLEGRDRPVVELAPLSEKEFTRLALNQLGVDIDKREAILAMIDDEEPTTNARVKFNNVALAIYDYSGGTRGKLIQSLMVEVKVAAVIGVENSTITFVAFDSEVTAEGKPDPIATAILKVLGFVVQDVVDGLPLPQLEALMGLYAEVDSVIIESKEVKAAISVECVKENGFVIPSELIAIAPEVGGAASLKAATPAGVLNSIVEF